MRRLNSDIDSSSEDISFSQSQFLEGSKVKYNQLILARPPKLEKKLVKLATHRK